MNEFLPFCLHIDFFWPLMVLSAFCLQAQCSCFQRLTCGVCATILLCTAPSEPGFKKDGFCSPLDALWIICTGSWKGNESQVWRKHNAHHEIFPTSGSWRQLLHLLKETPGSKQAWKCLSQHSDVQWGNHTGRFRHSAVKQTQPNNEMGSAGLCSTLSWTSCCLSLPRLHQPFKWI